MVAALGSLCFAVWFWVTDASSEFAPATLLLAPASTVPFKAAVAVAVLVSLRCFSGSPWWYKEPTYVLAPLG